VLVARLIADYRVSSSAHPGTTYENLPFGK